MHDLLSMPLQIVILGSGEKRYEAALLDWSKKYPDKLSVTIGYNEKLSHQLEAAADIFLMPSTFEPCGLNQLYSLCYGTLPVARDVGGLADTVIDSNDETIADKIANGFIIKEDKPAALLAAMQRALNTYKDQAVWKQLQLNAMLPDRSWKTGALQYIELYRQAINDNGKRL